MDSVKHKLGKGELSLLLNNEEQVRELWEELMENSCSDLLRNFLYFWMPFTDNCILQGYLHILDIPLISVELTELIYQEKQHTAAHKCQKP